MDGTDPAQHRQPLAMSRGDSPWGKDPGPDSAPDKAEPEVAQAESDAPFNPWLVPDEEPRPRRSASIEDIFKPGSGGSRGPVGSGWIKLLVGALLAAWLVGTSVHVLDHDERALVMTLGRYSDTIGPGANLTMPWPFQSLLRRSVGADVITAIPENTAEALMPTRDGELVAVNFKLRWRVSDLKAFTFNLPEGEAAIRRLADAQMRATVAELTFDAVTGGAHRAEIEQRALQRTQRVLNAWHSGVALIGVELAATNPPGQLASVFQKIGEEKEQARRQHDNDEAWRRQQIANANREVADFERVYAQYQIAPEITRINMYYEAMERILKVNQVIFGGSGTPTPLPPAPQPASAGGNP